jgi:Uncharacterized protein involved in chromosome partitioning
MAESTEVAVVEQPQQLITIEPKKYVELVFEPFAKQFETAKRAVREAAYDISTTAGMNTAIKWRATFRDIRVASEKARKLRKAPILEIGKLLDSRQNEIEATLLPLETLFDEEIKAEEGRKEAEKQAKLAVEKARVDAIHAKIDAIRRTPASFALKAAAELKAEADRLSETVISLDEFAEFTGDAKQARGKAVEQLRELQESAEEMEAAQARLAEERAQFERDRAAAEERDRQAAMVRAEQEAKDRAAREAAEREQRAAHEAEQRKLDDERREFEQQQAVQQAAADKLNAATSEIQGIQQQVIIATQGRAGVRAGGTIECIRETLAETEVWDIDPERFGILASAAESAKSTAVAEIRRLLAEAEARVVAEAAAKLEADHAEALEENARIDAARAAAAEAARIEAQQQADEAERLRRERVQFAINGPGDAAIVALLAKHYGVSDLDVVGWIERFDSKPYDDKIQHQKAA